MTARKTGPPGREHYKVRVVLPNALLHLASRTEPELEWSEDDHVIDARVVDVRADWLDDPELGDTVGYIDWSAVTGITWRYTG